MSEGARAFPLPSEIRDLPGAEGWQSMYPYFTRFRPEDDEVFWFYNAMHFPEPMPAFDILTAEIAYQALGAFTTRVFSFPTTRGIDHRIVNGRIYITAYPVTDPAEIQSRLAIFQERAGHYYQNWNSLYDDWRQRIEALIRHIEDIKVPALPEFDDADVVMKAQGIGQNHNLRTSYHRTVEALSTMWHHHFEFLMLGYGAYMVFFEFCKKAFPEIGDQMVARMVAGIDVFMFRPDEELKKLARLAVELGVGPKFGDGTQPQEILAALEQMGAPGREWLAALDKARHPWFLMSTGDGFYHHHRPWKDDLAVPFSAIARYIDMVQAGQSIARPTEQLKVERERIVADYRALLTNDDERGAFDQMLGLCHLVFPFVEDHKFYCEHWLTTLWFDKLREFGAVLARWDVIADPEDMFHMHHTEVDLALQEVSLAWASGGKAAGRGYWKPILEERKRLWEKLKEWSPPPALGPIPENISDPALQMLWGITSETLAAWARKPTAGLENELHGFAASPGVAEGVARVLKTANDIGEIREGEILVCPVTNPSWGPVFGKIKATVSDIGGTMSHAAIVAREYGMPAVVGTGTATQRITTGQRVRVNGDSGVVTILG